MEDLCLKILEQRGIKPTAIRMLVLKVMMETEQAVSLLDLENKLDTVDKSTIFRTITLFVSHHLAHSVDDGTGSLKYAVCDSECTCAVKDLHTHFCIDCKRLVAFTNKCSTNTCKRNDVKTTVFFIRSKEIDQSEHKVCVNSTILIVQH